MNHFFGPIRDQIVERNARSVLYRWSYVYRVLRDRVDRDKVADGYTRELHAGYFGSERRTEHWRVQQRHLRDLFVLARERGIAVGFVIFPVLAQLDEESYPFERVCNLLTRFARAEGVPALSLLDGFRGARGPDLWVSPYNQHPNPRAHELAAEALAPFVQRLLRQAEGESGSR